MAYSTGRLNYFSSLASELMGRFKPLFVLDASCGSGQLVYVLRYLGVNAFGIDQGRIYLSRIANNIKDFLVEADIDLSVLPFANEYFDLIVSHHSIEHLRIQITSSLRQKEF